MLVRTSIHETQIIHQRMSEHIIFYAERNASEQGYMKLKLYVSGRRSTSHTIFEARPWGKPQMPTTTTMLIPSVGETTTEMRYFGM
ncbi:hypothetical protein HanIR_Chr16g0791471 [Helianthus annuus]|nr:hypothetical protein HanIR_Chr16g0791471 [Helianthus annuus]